MACMPKFPFCPLQAGYSGDLVDGLLSTGVAGGPSFSRLDTTGNPFSISATWRLTSSQYDMFMGYVRNWIRSGGDLFAIDLIIERSAMTEYLAKFVSNTIRLVSKDGPIMTVSAELEVLPNFVDPCTDEWAARALLDAYFGDDACEAFEILDKAVTEDLVYVRT